jgi:hypothetical protein
MAYYDVQNHGCSDVSEERVASNYRVTTLGPGGRWGNWGEERGHYMGSLHDNSYKNGRGIDFNTVYNFLFYKWQMEGKIKNIFRIVHSWSTFPFH